MQCTIIKPGIECLFMKAAGCTFQDGGCKTVVESCEGCARIIEFDKKIYCTISPDPSSKWKRGNCNFATHLKMTQKEIKQKINPLKASKRGAGK